MVQEILTQKNCYLETKASSQDEALSWVDTQVVNPTSVPQVFTYTAANWRRDLGTWLDALIWDLGHGGNRKLQD